MKATTMSTVDGRVTKLLARAEELQGSAGKLRDVETRLRNVAISQSLNRKFGQPCSEEQKKVASQAIEAANRVAEMAKNAE